MNSFAKRFLCVFSVFLMLLLASCVQKPKAEETTEWEGKEEIEIPEEVDKETAALAARYEDYKEKVTLAFGQASPNADADFQVSEAEGGVRIDKYIGQADIVVIPENIGEKGVVSIAKNAFAEKKVRAIYIPDSVTSIEKSALEGVVGISTLRLPSLGNGENSYFGYIFGADSYEKQATKVPTSLDVVIFGEKVTEIADNAFAGCKGISALVFTEKLEKIGKFAFYECQDLVYIDLGGVKSIENYALGYCSSLYKVTLESAESFGLGVLYECNSLRELSLPFVGATVEENRYIGHIFGAETADYNDEFVPESLYSVKILGGEIPDRAFAGCVGVGEMILGEKVEKIGVRAFYSCRSLKNISIPDGVKTIGDDAFFGCDNLQSVELGSGVESIGMQAFYGCRALKSFEIPEKVTEIKPSTFALCASLENVKLNNVKKVGKDAFWGCKALKAVDCNGIEVSEGNVDLTTD